MVPKLITPAEFKALVDSVRGRDRLIIKLLAGTGDEDLGADPPEEVQPGSR